VWPQQQRLAVGAFGLAEMHVAVYAVDLRRAQREQPFVVQSPEAHIRVE
jgi:hypothetical protein